MNENLNTIGCGYILRGYFLFFLLDESDFNLTKLTFKIIINTMYLQQIATIDTIKIKSQIYAVLMD